MGRSRKTEELEVKIWGKFNGLAEQFMSAMHYSDYARAKHCHMQARRMADLLELDEHERLLLAERFPEELARKAYMECRMRNQAAGCT